MAVIYLNRGPSAGSQVLSGISQVLSKYADYKKKEKDKEERKEQIEKALKEIGYSNQKAKEYSGFSDDALNLILRDKMLKEKYSQETNIKGMTALSQLQKQQQKAQQDEMKTQAQSGILQSGGYPMDITNAAARAGLTKELIGEEGFMPGELPMPNVAWQNQLRNPNQQSIGERMGIPQQAQQQVPMQAQQQSTSPDASKPLDISQYLKSDPKQVLELRSLFKEGMDAGEINEQQAQKFLENLGVDKIGQRLALAKEPTPEIVQYVASLVNGDPQKAIKLLKNYGFKVKK